MTRDAFEAQHEKIMILIKSLELSRSELHGKASQNTVNIAIVISCLSLVFAGITLILKLVM